MKGLLRQLFFCVVTDRTVGLDISNHYSRYAQICARKKQ